MITNLVPDPDQNEEEEVNDNDSTSPDYRPLSTDEIVIDQDPNLPPRKQEKTPKKDASFCDSPTILINLILMIVMWTASSFCYYFITFFLKYIPGNIYVNTSISSISEIIAYVFSGSLMKILGTKVSYLIAWAVAILGGVLMVCFSNVDAAMGVFVLLSKFGVSFSFNNSYLATPMMFPVSLTATAFGLCNMVARLSTILSPVVAEFPFPSPMIVFTIVCIIAFVLTFFLRVIHKKPPTKA